MSGKITIKFILVFFLVVLLGVRLLTLAPAKTSQPSPSPMSLFQPNSKGISVTLENTDYSVFLQKIEDRMLTLIPNFSEKKSSAEIMKENGCTYGVNGGFYTKDNKPLGLFYTYGKFLNDKVHKTPFLNGFLYQNASGQIDLSNTPPNKTGSNFFFQSGPLFTPETNLKIRNDEKARRVLVGKTEAEEFYFVGVVESENINSGSLLGDLPQIFQQFNTSVTLSASNLTMKQFVLFLNLDGGSASAFYSTDGITLGELTSIGSFLCGK